MILIKKFNKILSITINWFKDTFFPLKLTLGKINYLLSCGLKYKFRYIYNLKEIVSEEYPQGLIGMELHRWIYRCLDKKVELDINKIKDSIMEKVYQKFPNLSDEDKKFHTENLEVMLTNFYNWYVSGNKNVYVTNYDIEIKLEGVIFTAKCDCILKTDDGYEIIDFVTSKNNVSQEMLPYDFDSNYMYFVLKTYFDKKKDGEKRFVIKKFFLRYNNISQFKENIFQQREVIKQLKEIKHILRNKDFEITKGPLCGWCGYYDICPGWKIEREGLPQKGIKPLAPQTTLFRIARETPGKMGLSYSKMSMFIQCPRRYRLCYIDKAGVKPQGFFSIGLTVHNTLEMFYQIDLKKGQTEPPIEELYKLYDENWISAGYLTEEEEKEYYVNGKEWLTNYYHKFVKGKYIKAYSVEEYFELPIGQGQHVMIGFYDRVQKNPDGSFEIFDYKTDPKVRTQEEVDKDLQLTIYYWSLKNRGIEAKRLSLIFIRFGEMVSTTRSQKDIEYIDNYVKEVADKMVLKGEQLELIRKEYKQKGENVPQEKVDEIFPATINKYCGGCDYLIGCPMETKIKTEYSDKLLFKVSETGQVIDKDVQQEITLENNVQNGQNED
jgi:putative RecB family exonuclease